MPWCGLNRLARCVSIADKKLLPDPRAVPECQARPLQHLAGEQVERRRVAGTDRRPRDADAGVGAEPSRGERPPSSAAYHAPGSGSRSSDVSSLSFSGHRRGATAPPPKPPREMREGTAGVGELSYAPIIPSNPLYRRMLMNKSADSRTIIPVVGNNPIMHAPDGPGPLDGSRRPDLFRDLVDPGHLGPPAEGHPGAGRPCPSAGAPTAEGWGVRGRRSAPPRGQASRGAPYNRAFNPKLPVIFGLVDSSDCGRSVGCNASLNVR